MSVHSRSLQTLGSRFPHLNMAMPAVFVLLWSSGFIFAKLVLPHAEPFTFLSLRFSIVAAILATLALFVGAPWPGSWRQAGHIALSGLLVQGIYLGGVFAAIHLGISAGVSALIVGVQPILTATVVGPLLDEAVRPRQWLGLLFGFVGVVLVVARALQVDAGGLAGFAPCVAGLLGITIGMVYQKKFCASLDLRTGTSIQFTAAALMMALLSLAFERQHIEWTGDFIVGLLWLSLVLSVGAISLLSIMIRHAAASRVASLFYLVPPITALMAYLVFGETLRPVAVLGMAIAAAGVALVNS
jgi:drug/metabolite transporter (DMT)-like permease